MDCDSGLVPGCEKGFYDYIRMQFDKHDKLESVIVP